MSKEIVAFCCEHSGYPAADLAGRLGLRYDQRVRIISIPCAGRIDVIHILKAFEKGASAVLIVGCEDGACHHLTGNTRAKERIEYCHTLLKEAGIDSKLVELINVAPNAPRKFAKSVNEIGAKV